MQLDAQHVNEFIYKVFNYYNGRINTFNPAVLHIEWTRHMGSENGATTRNPNVVTIFPRVIERHFSDPYWFHYNIILCIIHELHHIDQDISFIRMSQDPNYLHNIESIVELDSYLFMANHQREIAEQFGFEDIIPYNKYYDAAKDLFETGSLFIRKDYRTHMLSVLKDFLNCEEHPVIIKFDTVFQIPSSNIDVFINDKLFALKKGNLCMPIAQLNEILEDEFFKYNLRYAELAFGVDMNDKSGNSRILFIKTKCSNFIGKIAY